MQNPLSCLLNRLLGGKGDNLPRRRHQEPTLQQTDRGVYFIRPRVDVIENGKLRRKLITIHLGAIPKREAIVKMHELMDSKINCARDMVLSQVRFAALLEQYEVMHIATALKAPSRAKYRTHIKNHIKPMFGGMMLCEAGDSLLIQKWLNALERKPDGTPNLSWHTRTDLRNLMSSLFTKAIAWNLWKEKNPVEAVHAGRKKLLREKRKLTDDQTRRLLAALPYELRVACCVCLFCTTRISEAMGLQEKHLNFEKGVIEIRQRYYRGDLDDVKSNAARRDLPMGHLAADLKRLSQGDAERFLFQVETYPKWGMKGAATCRDDRDLNQHFLRPAAKALGFYWKGFGFHALRREAVTAISGVLGIGQAMKMAGHTSADMSILYTLEDLEKQDAAVRLRQEHILGKPEGKVQ